MDNWTQDLEMELGNANLHEDRIKYCHEFCELFPNSSENTIQNMKMAEAEGYFYSGQPEMAESLLGSLQIMFMFMLRQTARSLLIRLSGR